VPEPICPKCGHPLEYATYGEEVEPVPAPDAPAAPSYTVPVCLNPLCVLYAGK
jgi:hypothetical protein